MGGRRADNGGVLWRTGQVLDQKYLRMKSESGERARGLLFEEFLADLFGAEHYRNEQDLTANRRQIDLFVIRGAMRLVVEAKYARRPVHIDHIDQLRTRLEESPPDVMGLLVSMSGFTAQAIERTEQKSRRPILLVSGGELDKVVSQGGGLHDLLRQKLDHLTRYQRALFTSHPAQPRPAKMTELPSPGYRIVTPDGVDHPWWVSKDGFVGAVCSPVFGSIDWATSQPVSLDLSLNIDTEVELVDLLRKLTQLGWLTSEGTWRIEQVSRSWNGFGAANLVEALASRAERYASIATHHSESVFYVDHFDDGVFSLAADLQAATGRIGWCSLSFILHGWPLDSSVFDNLITELPVINRPTLQFGRDHAMSTHIYRRGRRGTTTPTTAAQAFLVRDAVLFEGQAAASEPSWVEGVVLTDPLTGRTKRHKLGLPAESFQTMFTWLRSQHHLGDDFVYEQLRVRTMHTFDVQVVHVTSDWLSPAGE